MRAARHFGIPPQPAELVARDATAWRGDEYVGRTFRPRANLEPPVETEGITRLPVGVCALIWVALLLPIWAGIIAVVRWAIG